ncbi:hypothetical protein OOZ58_43875, partial [Streptomyces tauricus]|nr:hypothetical protein [Streptomyces tauricus]
MTEAICIELADTLVEDFDLIDFPHHMTVRCTEILDVAECAVFLDHPGPRLHNAAPCDPSPLLQSVLESACGQGPAVGAHPSACPVTMQGPIHTESLWPQFTLHLRAAGYTRATALPMRRGYWGWRPLTLPPGSSRRAMRTVMRLPTGSCWT